MQSRQNAHLGGNNLVQCRRGDLDRQSLMLLHSKRMVVRRPVALVGRREVVRPLGKVAKVEAHAQIGMNAVDTRGSLSFSLCHAAVSLLGHGDGIGAGRAKVRKENVSGHHTPWKDYRRNSGNRLRSRSFRKVLYGATSSRKIVGVSNRGTRQTHTCSGCITGYPEITT